MQKHSIFTVFLCSFLLLIPLCTDAQVSQIQGPRNTTQVYSGVVYGPIDNSDTLWGIASRYKQDSQFSVYQTMYAIYELNPQAFENGNFNKMVSGAILQLPSDSYISKIDPNIAKEKALNDERRASTGTSTSQSTRVQPNAVSKDELSDTQKQLQEELNTIRSEQQQQFDLLKEQVSDSIKSVQILIQENKQLHEQLKAIDENNRTLTESVENQLQRQIDEQMTQLSEIVALVKAAEEQKRKQQEESIFSFLASPITIIVIMSVVTIALLVGLALLLLKRTAPVVQEAKPDEKIPDTGTDIIDDDLVIGEVDDEIDKDSNELLATLSENISDDDILSDELASDEALENLDDDLLTDELDSLDDMLVPDSPYTEDSKGDDDLDLSDVIEDLTDSELDGSKETEPVQISEKEGVTDETTNTETSQPIKEGNAPQNELAQSSSTSDNPEGTPDGIELNDNGDIDDKTLNQIEEQIEQKDNTINALADDIIANLDAGTSGSAEESEETNEIDEVDLLIQQNNSEQSDASENEKEPSSNIQKTEVTDSVENKEEIDEQDLPASNVEIENNIEDVSIDLTTPEDDVDRSDSDLDQLSEDLLGELTEQDHDTQELDDLLDSLSEFEEENSTIDQDKTENKQNTQLHSEEEAVGDDNDVLADDLLEELEGSQELDSSSEVSDASEKLESSNAVSDANIDEEDFLNDIPSFTSDFSANEESNDQVESKEIANSEIVTEDQSAVKHNETNKTELTDEPSKSEEPSEAKLESEEDVLSSLPDLDNWVDEEPEQSKSNNQTEEVSDDLDLSALELDVDDLDLSDTEIATELTNEEDILNEIDDNDFDDMLNELSNEELNDASSNQKSASTKESSQFEEAGLDLEQLTSEDSLEDDKYLDVDDLIKESESSKTMTDDDLVLDLDKSLGNLTFGSESSDKDEASFDELEKSNDQSGNLDLAQVYIDMEDVEAASELLAQVIKDGTAEEQKEAKSLLASISNS